MARKQYRIKQSQLEETQQQWLGQSLSVVFETGAVLELRPHMLEKGAIEAKDALGRKHKIFLNLIREIILNLPVADAHAQTSAD